MPNYPGWYPLQYQGQIIPNAPALEQQSSADIAALLNPPTMFADTSRKAAEIGAGRGVSQSAAAYSGGLRMTDEERLQRMALGEQFLTGAYGRNVPLVMSPWQQASANVAIDRNQLGWQEMQSKVTPGGTYTGMPTLGNQWRGGAVTPSAAVTAGAGGAVVPGGSSPFTEYHGTLGAGEPAPTWAGVGGYLTPDELDMAGLNQDLQDLAGMSGMGDLFGAGTGWNSAPADMTASYDEYGPGVPIDYGNPYDQGYYE